jgi:hypothetical protein
VPAGAPMVMALTQIFFDGGLSTLPASTFP